MTLKHIIIFAFILAHISLKDILKIFLNNSYIYDKI